MSPILRGTRTEPVSAFMSRRIVSVTPRTTVQEASELAAREQTQHLLVFDNEELAGVVCRCDLESARPASHVGDLIRRPIVTADASTTRADAAELMAKRAVGCLPLLAGGLLLGVVTRTDMLRAGVPAEDLGGPCSSCGSQHHLPGGAPEEGTIFCSECLECRPERAETGGGD